MSSSFPSELEKIKLLMQFAAAFHRYGMNSFRLEAALVSIAKSIDVEAAFYCTPTMITGTFETAQGQISRMERVTPGDIHLKKLCEVDQLADRMAFLNDDSMNIAQELKSITQQVDPYHPLVRIFFFGLASACFALILSLRWLDTLIAFGLGIIGGLVDLATHKYKKLAEMKEAFAAIIIMAMIGLLGQYTSLKFHPGHLILASLLNFLPGLSLTVALAELSMNHLSSGTAKLMGAMITLLKLAFGIMLSYHLFGNEMLLVPKVAADLPTWLRWVGVCGSGFSLGILFKAAKKDIFLVFISAFIGAVATTVGKNFFGAEMSAFVGGITIGAFSNTLARVLHRPVSLFLLPGITLSVPGALGLKSVQSLLLGRDITTGLGEATVVLAVAISLVVGFLFGNLLINPRRNL